MTKIEKIEIRKQLGGWLKTASMERLKMELDIVNGEIKDDKAWKKCVEREIKMRSAQQEAKGCKGV